MIERIFTALAVTWWGKLLIIFYSVLLGMFIGMLFVIVFALYYKTITGG